MQKDRFVHEDIWSVCNSAAKKLFSLGVWGAVSIALVPNTALAGGCHSRFERRQTTQNHTETETQQSLPIPTAPVTHNAPSNNQSLVNEEETATSQLYIMTVGTSFLVVDRGTQPPSNPRGLPIIYPGDFIHTSDGALIEVIDFFVNYTGTVLNAGQIKYTRLNAEPQNQNAGSSFMNMMLRDFSFTPQQKEEFVAEFSTCNKK